MDSILTANKENVENSSVSTSSFSNESIISHFSLDTSFEPKVCTESSPLARITRNKSKRQKLSECFVDLKSDSPPKASIWTNIQNEMEHRHKHQQKSIQKSTNLIKIINRHEIKQHKFEETVENCNQIIAHLKLEDIMQSHSFGSPMDIFRFLEEDGKLSAQVLKFFSSYEKITSVNLTPSYGSFIIKGPCRLISDSRLDPTGCTAPFYGRFEQLEMLDLNNVAVKDEEIRYLIKLSNLKALGLSNTKISEKSLIYLGIYAKFAKTLQCLMISGNSVITDYSVKALSFFEGLVDLDLFATGITIHGARELADAFKSKQLSSVRFAKCVYEFIKNAHLKFFSSSQPTAPEEILKMNRAELIRACQRFGNSYGGEFNVSQSNEYLRFHLLQIGRWRRNEEFLWSILQF